MTRYIGELIDRLIPIAAALGIETVTVDGDLADHPEFHDPTYAVTLSAHTHARESPEVASPGPA